MTNPADLDGWLDDYQPPVEEVPICGKPGLMAEFVLVESQVFDAAKESGIAGAPQELKDRLAALEAEVDASVIVVKVQAQNFKAWVDLLALHPPTPEERASGFDVHPETFYPAALAMSAVDPVFTVEQATRLAEKAPPADWSALIDAVRRLHGQRVASPKSLLLSALRRANDASSATQPNEGSLAEPSSDVDAEQ